MQVPTWPRDQQWHAMKRDPGDLGDLMGIILPLTIHVWCVYLHLASLYGKCW